MKSNAVSETNGTRVPTNPTGPEAQGVTVTNGDVQRMASEQDADTSCTEEVKVADKRPDTPKIRAAKPPKTEGASKVANTTNAGTDEMSLESTQTGPEAQGVTMEENKLERTESEQEAETASVAEPQMDGNGPDTPEGSGPVAAEPPDPFDPERLRLSQKFGAELGVKKALLTVPVRKPAKEWWIRTHPDESYRVETALLELKEENELYLIEPDLWNRLATEATFGPRALFTAINRQGVLFLWPVRMPGPDGRLDPWNRSALQAASMAQEGWVRVQANRSLGAYEVSQAQGDIPEPQWPEESLRQLLEVAFRDRFVRDLDHPVLRQLRGEE